MKKCKDDKVLCPDCKLNFITKEKLEKYHKCNSCVHRETTARTHNIKYIRFIDLSKEEQNDILRKRAKKKGIKVEEVNNNVIRKNQIYTPELIEEIKEIASEEISSKKLQEYFANKYPDLKITFANFNNIITRHNIPHKSRISKNKKENKISNKTIQQDNKNSLKQENKDNKEQIKKEVKDKKKKEIVKEIKPKKEKKSLKFKNIDKEKEKRLEPIRKEVFEVLNKRFEEEGCVNKYDFDITDYIKMLQMIQYLSNNIIELISNRNKQYNIVNNYQFDVLHEMENELSEEGDTYFQDKMFVLRDYRRWMEIDYKALNKLRPILKLIKKLVHPYNPNNITDLNTIQGCINQLNTEIENNTRPVYRPRVDETMTNKYDWALEGYTNINNTKQEEDKSNIIQEEIVSKKDKVKIYRVNCQISGGGYGVFTDWHKDYKSATEAEALGLANKDFNEIRQKNNGVLFTGINCIEISK